MAMKNCKECGNLVSTKANFCPKCGAVPKTKRGCFRFILALSIALLGILIILFMMNKRLSELNNESTTISKPEAGIKLPRTN